MLYTKDLVFVDPDDNTPLKQVLNFYNRELTSVYNDSKLDELLEQFAGGQCHLALVNMVVQEGSGDPQLQVVGESATHSTSSSLCPGCQWGLRRGLV